MTFPIILNGQVTVSGTGCTANVMFFGPQEVDGEYRPAGTDATGRNRYRRDVTSSTLFITYINGTDEWVLRDTFNNVLFTNSNPTTPDPPATDWSTGINGCNGSPAPTLSGNVSNIAPTETANTGKTIDEGTMNNTILQAELEYEDAEQGPAEVTYTLDIAPSEGTLRNNGSAIFSGATFTQADINNGLITYDHNGSEAPTDFFRLDISDGAGGQVDDVVFNLTITAVNDAPVVTAPGAALTTDPCTGQLALEGAGFSFTDADAGSGTLLLTLSIAEGTITVDLGDSGAALTSANGGSAVTISGTAAQLNSLLTGTSSGTLVYTNTSPTVAATSLTVLVNDNGNTGLDPGTSGDGTSEAGSASQIINLATDSVDPQISCPGSLDLIAAGAGCMGTIPDLLTNPLFTVSDNCDTDLSVAQSPQAGGMVEVGNTVITITVEDDDGNMASCTYTLTVEPSAQELQISAAASCTDALGNQVAENTYFVEVSAVSGGDGSGTVEVSVGGETFTFSGSPIFFGPFTHSGNGGAIQVVTASQNSTTACTFSGTAEVPEVLCGVKDGGQASGPFCQGPVTSPGEPYGAILAQSQPGTFETGGTSGQVQKYLLADDNGIIVAMNQTGLFTDLEAGTYTPYAINYRLDEEAMIIGALAVGQPIQPVINGSMDIGPLASLCYSLCNADNSVMYTVEPCYSVGSTVFIDSDNDGMLETADGESGISGILVELYTDGDNPDLVDPIAMTTTDPSGNYYFGGLDAGDYFIQLPTAPALFPNSSTVTDEMDNGQDNDDNGIQNMAGGTTTSPIFTLGDPGGEPSGGAESGLGSDQDALGDEFGDMTQDFGFFAPVSVGDFAFVDLDADGIQTVGEPGIANVTATIFDNATGAEVAFDAEGLPYDPITTTDVNGLYAFENLPPGNYFVVFDISTADNAEFYDFTTPNVGLDTDDSDAIPQTATTGQTPPTGFLPSGTNDPTLDVGIVCIVAVTVADDATICGTQLIDLTQGASVTPTTLAATWITPDGTGDFTTGESFATATTYEPSEEDIDRGTVTLILTTDNPDGPCEAVSAMVTFTILKVDCGSFFWDGGE